MAIASKPAFADALSAGKKAAENGDYAKAYAKWSKSSAPEAPYLIGLHASWGRIPNCDANCALAWLQKSVERDYVPALTGIGELYYIDGQIEKGVSVLTYAARWNDSRAREFLASINQPDPGPDLWNAHVEKLRIAEAARQQNQQQALANISDALLFAAVVGAANGSAGQPGYAPTGYSNVSGIENVGTQQWTKMCPNGQYVIGDQCVMAPDGTYVGGQPTRAPDGSYIGGNGPTRTCPDGSYVKGAWCKMMPDGTYVGVN